MKTITIICLVNLIPIGLPFKRSSSEIEANTDLNKVEDEDVREVIEGQGLFRNKKAAKRISKIVDALDGKIEPEVEGKGLRKAVKKGAKKLQKVVNF